MAAITPHQEDRPWGRFIEFTHNALSTVKIITVNPGESLSLQSHTHREEFWHILSGAGTITIGEQKLPVRPGQQYSIPASTLHRMEAGAIPLEVLEIATGQFDENDIIRVEDKYGRTPN